jgi:pyruvate-ferredoxin/flavodoxin oxidoreductase
LEEVRYPGKATSGFHKPPIVRDEAPDFVKKVSAVMLAGKGDLLPVSAFPVDGTWPTATTQWEKRNIALDIPIWSKDFCIQCNKCTMVCPHAAIRAKVYEPGDLADAPATFETQPFKGSEFKGLNYTIQVAPEDCTGCNLCVQICPGKDKANPKHKAINMLPHAEHKEREKVNYDFFLSIPELDRTKVARFDVKTTQFYQPLFEYSGACAGCGETPYIKLLTQLYGDRLLIANATGCSSIYGGNLPTTPYAVDQNGRGPAWANSLFEDNAEFGLGFRLAIDAQIATAHSMAKSLSSQIGDTLLGELLAAEQHSEAGIAAQRARVVELRKKLAAIDAKDARRLDATADYFVRKSVWVIGGDGWAYDIGYGGLDHVLSMKYDVNLLVLDTEVYSNTGGQASKATPIGAAAKFASKGKPGEKKDLGLMALQYGHVYVASIAFGARDGQTVSAMMAADSYDGPSLVIAYSHCIAHGYDMMYGADQQKKAVESGIWPVYRYDPRRVAQGEAPLVIDMPGGKLPVQEYMKNETRFRMVEKIDPEGFKEFAKQAQLGAQRRMATYQHIAQLKLPKEAQLAVAATAPSKDEE